MDNQISQLNIRNKGLSSRELTSYIIFIILNFSFIAFFKWGELVNGSDRHGDTAILLGVLIGFINFIFCSVILIMLIFRKNRKVLLFAILTFLDPVMLMFVTLFSPVYNVLIILFIAIDIIRNRRIRDNSNAECELNMLQKHPKETNLRRNLD